MGHGKDVAYQINEQGTTSTSTLACIVLSVVRLLIVDVARGEC